jgi:hypothetical protein
VDAAVLQSVARFVMKRIERSQIGDFCLERCWAKVLAESVDIDEHI